MVKRESTHAAPGWVAPGRRIYAIGDVHGCARRLSDLHGIVAADLARSPNPSSLLVHLGDYIDRGPDSATVVRMLAEGPVPPGIPTINLRGGRGWPV